MAAGLAHELLETEENGEKLVASDRPPNEWSPRVARRRLPAGSCMQW